MEWLLKFLSALAEPGGFNVTSSSAGRFFSELWSLPQFSSFYCQDKPYYIYYEEDFLLKLLDTVNTLYHAWLAILNTAKPIYHLNKLRRF